MSHCDIRPSQPETPLVIAVCLACHRILPCSLTRPRARNFGPGLVKRGILDWPCLCLVFFFFFFFLAWVFLVSLFPGSWGWREWREWRVCGQACMSMGVWIWLLVVVLT